MSRSWMLVPILVLAGAFALLVSGGGATRRDAVSAASPGLARVESGPVAAGPFLCGGSGSLRVEVTFARDGSPAAAMRVAVIAFTDRSAGRRPISGLTDDHGVVTLESVPAGPVRIFAADGSRYWCLDPGARNDVELALDDGYEAMVLVTDAHGAVIPGAEVWVSGPGSSDRGALAGSTGEDGRRALKDFGRGSWIAARTGNLGWSDRRPLADEDGTLPRAREVTLILTRPAWSIRGSVVDEAGDPVPGAWVAAERSSEAGPGPPVVETTTDHEGAFVLDGLVPGDWAVEAWSEDFAPALARVAVGAGDDPAIALVLATGASVEGCIKDDSGRPLARVEVTAFADGFIGRAAQTTSSADGRFRLDHLPRALLAARAGYLAGDCVRASLDARGVDHLAWNPVIRTGRIIAGVVRDECGRGRPFARVRAEAIGERDGWCAECIADAGGCFEIANTPEGPFEVAIDVARWGDGGTWRLSGVRPGPDPVVVVIPESARPSCFITGVIVSPEGAPLAGGLVTASRLPEPRDASGEGRSDSDGSFRVGPLAPGDYLIESASARGSRMTVAEGAVSAGEEWDLGERRLGREGFLEVFLKPDPAGQGSEQLVVVDRWRRAVMRLRPVGGFAASGPLAPGGYGLRVQSGSPARAQRGLGWEGGGVLPNDLAFEIKDGETTTVEVPVKAK